MYDLSVLKSRPIHSPYLDIYEEADALVLRVDMPGVTANTLRLSLKGQVLRIHGRPGYRVPQGVRAIHEEAPPGDFYRALILTGECLTEDIAASVDDGVLTIRIPKAK